jgi:hypothetical protein
VLGHTGELLVGISSLLDNRLNCEKLHLLVFFHEKCHYKGKVNISIIKNVYALSLKLIVIINEKKWRGD